MKRFLLAMCLILTGATEPSAPQWSKIALDELRAAAAAAPADALPAMDVSELDDAWRSSDPAKVDLAATRLALKLARMELLGSAPPAARAGWKIADSDSRIDLDAGLVAALAQNRVGAWLAGLAPQHPDYAALRSAYATETDPAKRLTLARNMERWRWMPHDLGGNFLLVNAASFEVRLWRDGKQAGTWRVIVGKPATPTPVFGATVTGVTINPWWDVPPNIVRESIGALIRRHPATARARGYVWGGGRIRQKPGKDNSLGFVKLVMPNPYSVYLHDTPNRDLFNRDQRAFSHGCIRVGDALDFAATLLDGARDRAGIDALVAQGETVTLDLPRHLPVYVTYFTAGLRGDGTLGYFPDLYGRDGRIAAAPRRRDACWL